MGNTCHQSQRFLINMSPAFQSCWQPQRPEHCQLRCLGSQTVDSRRYRAHAYGLAAQFGIEGNKRCIGPDMMICGIVVSHSEFSYALAMVLFGQKRLKCAMFNYHIAHGFEFLATFLLSLEQLPAPAEITGV